MVAILFYKFSGKDYNILISSGTGYNLRCLIIDVLSQKGTKELIIFNQRPWQINFLSKKPEGYTSALALNSIL